jgi:DNA ligase-1
MKKFTPMLAPNQKIDINTLKYPLLASYKLDGIRCIFKDGQMFSRALKQFPNIQLRKRFEYLAKYSKDHNVILDGELLAKSLTFNELSGITRQLDKKLPDDLLFYCFDAIHQEDYTMSFRTRTTFLETLDIKFEYFKLVVQWAVNNVDEVNDLYENALAWGCDGLILRSLTGKYKFGRGTIKEGLIFKMKPFETFDAQITGVIQATEVREGAEKKINELGRSVTSKKKDDRVLIEKAAAFTVLYEGKELKVTIGMKDIEKLAIWKNRNKYIGRWIEYKGMLVGAKDLPRHPTFKGRFRDDKE